MELIDAVDAEATASANCCSRIQLRPEEFCDLSHRKKHDHHAFEGASQPLP